MKRRPFVELALGKWKQRGTTKVSPEDAEVIEELGRTISVCREGYASISSFPESGCYVYLHRLIMVRVLGRALSSSECIDHINGDKLDNRRENLRVCTKAQNLQNRGATRRNRSGFKGVSWIKKDKRWRAAIGVGGQLIYLGQFRTIEEAAVAYAEAAEKYHGDFANTGVSA